MTTPHSKASLQQPQSPPSTPIPLGTQHPARSSYFRNTGTSSTPLLTGPCPRTLLTLTPAQARTLLSLLTHAVPSYGHLQPSRPLGSFSLSLQVLSSKQPSPRSEMTDAKVWDVSSGFYFVFKPPTQAKSSSGNSNVNMINRNVGSQWF